jgi:hypothetical protein
MAFLLSEAPHESSQCCDHFSDLVGPLVPTFAQCRHVVTFAGDVHQQTAPDPLDADLRMHRYSSPLAVEEATRRTQQSCWRFLAARAKAQKYQAGAVRGAGARVPATLLGSRRSTKFSQTIKGKEVGNPPNTEAPPMHCAE